MNMSIDDIKIAVEHICRQYNVEHLFLFGSYATGTATTTSDIDFVVKGTQNCDVEGLLEEIEQIPTLKKIDLFFYDKCDNNFLKEDMDLYGQQIY